ncbi:MAG: hypothetical protein PHW31_01175 [Candidatus Pacebacteria bacterium]|nr:hypothetical protein [Candidatus Paceibacterota bacterium]
MMTNFNHIALGLQKERKLVYTAMSKHFFYFRFFISQFAVKQGVVPLNPFLLWDYFLLDTVERDEIREANNNLVARADETWVFGPVSNGVLAEIKIAQEGKKPVKFFKIEKPNKIIPIFSKDEIEMEDDVKDFKNEINFNNQKIVICGSVFFANEIVEAKNYLEKKGYEVTVPWGIYDFVDGGRFQKDLYEGLRDGGEGAKRKKENNLIKGYYDEIAKADAILVINKEKREIQNYIGGNSFLEMGFAHCLGKKIYCLNPLNEEQKVFYEEMVAMQPIILNNDLSKMTL